MRLSQDWVLPFLGERKVKFERSLKPERKIILLPAYLLHKHG